jgi:phosphohistidine phosphatase
MLVTLFRHGIAVDDDDPKCPADPDRWLTKEGIEKTRDAARGLERLGIAPGAVLSSPYLRARQTAGLAIEVLTDVQLAITVTAALLPGADPSELRRELRALDAESVLCAGHAPHLDRMLAHLVGSSTPISQLKKAGAAIIEIGDLERRRGVIVELLSSRSLRHLD